MIIKTEELQSVCQKILLAVDNNKLSTLTETLELYNDEHTLYLNVTNREYFVQVKLNIESSDRIHATVNASTFLKLISQVTSSDIELSVDDEALTVKGNGIYKFELIFDDDKMLTLPKIEVKSVENELSVSKDILTSIANFNTKQLSLGYISNAVQRLYYIDGEGAITFTTGACVNNFHLDKNIKMFVNSKIVKLFKLFNDDTVNIAYGHNTAEDITQTVISFTDSSVTLTAILAYDESLFSSIPVGAIRKRAETIYPYAVVFNRLALTQTLNRIAVFESDLRSERYITFKFGKTDCTISDSSEHNHETIKYDNEDTGISDEYILRVDASEIKSCIDVFNDSHINMRFGDESAIVISKNNVSYVVPEMQEI